MNDDDRNDGNLVAFFEALTDRIKRVKFIKVIDPLDNEDERVTTFDKILKGVFISEPKNEFVMDISEKSKIALKD